MTLLYDLSDELILEILLSLEFEKQSLLNANLVSRRLGRLGQSCLYKHVRLDVFAENFKRFSQSIENNRLLGHLVRDLFMSWIVKPGVEFPAKSPQEMLSRLPRLQKISLLISSTRLFDSCLHVRPLSSACRYTLMLRSHYSEMTDLENFIFENRIHSLEVDQLAIPNLRDVPKSSPTSTLGTAPLESLDLHYSICIPLSALKTLLSFPANLRSLSCAIPGTSATDVLSAAAMYINPRPRGPLHPSAIASALSPAAHSLEKLALYGEGDKWSLHDGSRLDLSAFDALRHLHVASYLFFDSPKASPSRDGTYALLPPSLENLTITFDFGDYVLTTAAPSRNAHARADADPFPFPSQYTWLSEIAAQKPTHFPALKSMTLMERVNNKAARKGRRQGPEPGSAWAVPEDLRGTFATAGVELLMRRRMG